MTLEEIVNERNAIYAGMREAAEHPNTSYTARKNLGAILHSDYPVDVPNQNEYLNKESILNEYLRLSVKKREDEIKSTVGADIQKYIAKVKDESLAELALSLDSQYIEIVTVDSPEKMQKLVMKYAKNPELCMDLILTAPHPEIALKETYASLVQIKRAEIENTNRLYTISDRGIAYNRKNVESYFMKNLNASNEKLKGAAYLKIADEYCSNRN